MMSNFTPTGRLRCLFALGLALCVLGGAASLPARVDAQSTLKTPAERVVQGTVVNKDGGAAQDGVVVYLQDTKTEIIRSYVTNHGGHFHFNQLSADTDYQVWAERNKQRSKKHTVSMFSSHLKFTYTLKV